MKRIELYRMVVEGDRILYEIVQDAGVGLLKQDRVKLFVRFHNLESVHVDLNKIPQSILAVPISLYLLPLTYFYKIELVLPTIDKMLYGRLPDIYAAYSNVYGPFKEEWRGKLTVKTIADTPAKDDEAYDKVVFFSGGVDACSAGINNPGRKTLLVSIPDIEILAKNEGPLREEKFSLIRAFSSVINSDWVLISNNFNAALFNDHEIKKELRTQKGLCSPAFEFDGWLGMKFLANMCCVAPLAYALGVKDLIMGSGFSQIEDRYNLNDDGAHPSLSNSIAFSGVRFGDQDGLYTRRTMKVSNIIKWCNSHGKRVKLWTCFCDKSSQCGVCHKCVRTQLNILCAGENPKNWGFENFDEKKFSHFMYWYRYYEKNPCFLWDVVDAIDTKRGYVCCNHMLHWLKRIGYKEYMKRARSRIVWLNRFRRIIRIFYVHKYPHYMKRICERLVKCLKSER
ncbi:MAG: hypothetical protein IKF72_09405 [Kiritimatiellae bacterium]|nr:hypothetical protein [Kiritimatiellia bacterium]